MPRVMIFVDGANLYSCVKQAFGVTSVDFEKVRDELTRGRALVRMYYYNAPLSAEGHGLEKARSQQKFFAALKCMDSVEVRLGKLVGQDSGEYRQKGVDVRLALDVARYALQDRYDVAVVVSGDSDVVEAVVIAKDQGKRVENAFTRLGSSLELRQASDCFIELDKQFFDRCALRKSSGL